MKQKKICWQNKMLSISVTPRGHSKKGQSTNIMNNTRNSRQLAGLVQGEPKLDFGTLIHSFIKRGKILV